ncbi:hypothetical protein NURINAE_00310 [Candidatus Nitrosacidococcus sp. I8]|nr:hypothetical protein NURINAE_00310 [Candidatus Nitrosacidococcus sp. I8]
MLFELPFVQDKNLGTFKNQEIDAQCRSSSILQNTIRSQLPDIVDILLTDRTTSTTKKKKNIIWANENYLQYSKKDYAVTAQIRLELITGPMNQIIIPRALKSRTLQKERTKSKAEIFTPTRIIKKQNDIIEQNYLNDDLETYIKRTWLETACGEAPYMATRYDMETGEIISLTDRVGFMDRKLQRINAEVNDKTQWQQWVEKAYKASYGFEWNGDSLLLARENLLYTYHDYYFAKWHEEPIYDLYKNIAEIISYNVFQMDGLKYIIPLSEKREKITQQQMSFFNDEELKEQWIIKSGERVKIKNWNTGKMEFFDHNMK